VDAGPAGLEGLESPKLSGGGVVQVQTHAGKATCALTPCRSPPDARRLDPGGRRPGHTGSPDAGQLSAATAANRASRCGHCVNLLRWATLSCSQPPWVSVTRVPPSDGSNSTPSSVGWSLGSDRWNVLANGAPMVDSRTSPLG